MCLQVEPWEPLVGPLCRLLGRLSEPVNLEVRIKMSVTSVEAQVVRWKHRTKEPNSIEVYCTFRKPEMRERMVECTTCNDGAKLHV